MLFGRPIGTIVAVTRLALAIIAFVAIQAFPPQAHASLLRVLLLIYVVGASIVTVTELKHSSTARSAYLCHGFDITISSALMYYCQGDTSAFFVLYVFALLSSAAQWNWKGALTTTLILLLALISLMLFELSTSEVTVGHISGDLLQVALRAGFLLTCGAMMAYFAALRERSRSRYERVAEGSKRDIAGLSTDRLKDITCRIADVLQADRVIVRYETKVDRRRTAIEWSSGTLRYVSWFADAMEPSHPGEWDVAPESEAAGTRASDRPGSKRTDRKCARSALSPFKVAFESEGCYGQVTVCGPRVWSQEDHTLLRILASQIGAEIEEESLRAALQAVAAREERLRLARDLHDGPLQGIAAANLQLGIVSRQLPEHVQRQLKETRSLLSGEARRIRSTIQTPSARAMSAPKSVKLARTLNEQLAQLSRQWGCCVLLNVYPANLKATESDVAHLENMVSEAVSNAVRHGQATEVEISVQRSQGSFIIDIQDNGSGCLAIEGTYSHATLASDNLGPRMLRSRAESLGGSLRLTSTVRGTGLHIEFGK
ncbi:sensor histidine kinase [Methylobacterium soli]|uniref:sensor histidine kinase n=1 Tax=Methylobacterium soli TaxID=553447 RepID=UPI00177BEC84|nr:histidine kinase [Methylobacterium soli]